jgi:hypothetical protein
LAGEQRGAEGEEREKSSLELQIKDAIDRSKKGRITIVAAEKDYEITEGRIIKVPGNQMADFSIDDTVFIQHKQLIFQQLSGFIKTQTKGILSEAALNEMKEFEKAIKRKVGGIMPRKTAYKQRVETLDLIRAALFGSTTRDFSEDKVQLICQGEIKLVELGKDKYTVQGASKELTLAYSDETIPDKWHPYMIARYSSTHSQYGVKNARFNFATKDYYAAATLLPSTKTAV